MWPFSTRTSLRCLPLTGCPGGFAALDSCPVYLPSALLLSQRCLKSCAVGDYVLSSLIYYDFCESGGCANSVPPFSAYSILSPVCMLPKRRGFAPLIRQHSRIPGHRCFSCWSSTDTNQKYGGVFSMGESTGGYCPFPCPDGGSRHRGTPCVTPVFKPLCSGRGRGHPGDPRRGRHPWSGIRCRGHLPIGFVPPPF